MQNLQTTAKTYTTHQIARMCGVDPITVARWFDSGVLKGFRTPGGHRRVAEAELQAFLAQQGIPERAPGGQASILIIDDDQDLLRLLCVQFERAGLRVSSYASGIDGLLRVGTERPDVVLLDVFMDGLDGRDVFRRIRANPELRHTQVAFMTGKLTPKLRAELEALKPLAVFTKPVDAKVVAAAVVGARRMP